MQLLWVLCLSRPMCLFVLLAAMAGATQTAVGLVQPAFSRLLNRAIPACFSCPQIWTGGSVHRDESNGAKPWYACHNRCSRCSQVSNDARCCVIPHPPSPPPPPPPHFSMATPWRSGHLAVFTIKQFDCGVLQNEWFIHLLFLALS